MRQPIVSFDDSVVVVVPDMKCLHSVLKYTEKKLVQDPAKPWLRKTKREVQQIYEVTPDPTYGSRLTTWSGMLDRVVDTLKNEGYNPDVRDKRRKLPAPRLDFMHGFRFSQEALLSTALLQERSGLVGAPTRYGKTILIVNTCRAYPNLRTVIVSPGVDLLDQTLEDLRKKLPHREIVMMGGNARTKFQGDDITLCSMDSLHKLADNGTDLVLIDEPHQLVTDGRLPDFKEKFWNARKIGYGATMTGRYDNRDVMIEAAIGPILSNRTYLEAVAEGAICPIRVIVVPLTLRQFAQCHNRDKAYDVYFRQSEYVGKVVGMIRELIPADAQTLVFISNEDQARFFQQFLPPDTELAMDKLMTRTERKDKMARMRAGEIRTCVSSNIYSTGVTFSDLLAVINLSGGGASTLSIQKPGRLAEIRPGKKRGVMFDFQLRIPDSVFREKPWLEKDPVMALVREGQARIEAYTEKGYEMVFANNPRELKEAVAAAFA